MKAAIPFLFFVSVLLPTGFAQDSKPEKVAAVLIAVEAVQHLAHATDTSVDELNVKLDGIFSKRTADELAKIAVTCHLIAYPQDAGKDIPFDKVFDIACWRCITLLFRSKSVENLDALKFIEHYGRFDGGDKMAFDELMEKFNK